MPASGQHRINGVALAPPRNVEAERALIGAMMRQPELVPEIADLIRSADYAVGAHQLIHRAIVVLHTAGRGLDLVTIADALQAEGQLEDAGGSTYLVEIWDVRSGANYREHA